MRHDVDLHGHAQQHICQVQQGKEQQELSGREDYGFTLNLSLLLYKSHYAYLFIFLFGEKPTPPTVLNVENSKLACRLVIQFLTT